MGIETEPTTASPTTAEPEQSALQRVQAADALLNEAVDTQLATDLAAEPVYESSEDRPITRNVFEFTPDPFLLNAVDMDYQLPPERAPHPMEGQVMTEVGASFNEALKLNPSLGKYWQPMPEEGPAKAFTYWEAAKNAMHRESFARNSMRWADQIFSERDRNAIDERAIWDARDELTHGISSLYHDDILGQPTWDLAVSESKEIRHRQEMILREQATGLGTSLLGDITGFVLAPSNIIPGFGIMKGITALRGVKMLAGSKILHPTTKTQRINSMFLAGGLEETLRAHPRYMTDVTYSSTEHLTAIAMNAAFTGLLPVVFGHAAREIGSMAEVGYAVRDTLNHWGVDVAFRQVMKTPGNIVRGGFKDVGDVVRATRQEAKDHVADKFKTINVHTRAVELREELEVSVAGDAPDAQGMLNWANARLDEIGEAARKRIHSTAGSGRMTEADIGVSSAEAIQGAPLTKNQYMEIAKDNAFLPERGNAIDAASAEQSKALRRAAYQAALNARDTRGAAQILRMYKNAKPKGEINTVNPNSVDTPELRRAATDAQIDEAIAKAKARLQTTYDNAVVC